VASGIAPRNSAPHRRLAVSAAVVVERSNILVDRRNILCWK
jgi:hypothetical protein